MRLAPLLTLALGLLLTGLLPGDATGHDLGEDGFYLTPGFSLAGASNLDQGTGFAPAAALHLMHWKSGFKLGLASEWAYDFNREASRILLAPSIGFGPYGIDAGYLAELGEDRTRHGAMIRLYVAFLVRLHIGYAWMPDAPDFLEWGLQIKLPLRIPDFKLGVSFW